MIQDQWRKESRWHDRGRQSIVNRKKNGMDPQIHAALFLVPKPGLECKELILNETQVFRSFPLISICWNTL
jgi:hypothetical protein